MALLLEYLHLLGFHLRKILGVPEVRILEVFVRAIAKQTLDVLADEARRVVAARLEAIDHSPRRLIIFLIVDTQSQHPSDEFGQTTKR